MNAETFDEIVAECVTSGSKSRLLYVFIRIGVMDAETKKAVLGADAADEDAGFVQVLLDAHQPAAHGLTFEAVRDAADAQNKEWDMVVVAVAKNSDNTLPSDEQARGFLASMRERVLEGDIGDFAILDRTGAPVPIATEPADDGAPVH